MDWTFTRCVGGPFREIPDPPLHTLTYLVLSSFLNDCRISMEIWLSCSEISLFWAGEHCSKFGKYFEACSGSDLLKIVDRGVTANGS